MKQYIYIASCCEDGGIYRLEWENGKLQQKAFTPMDRPMYMIVQGNTMHVLLRAPFDNNYSGLVSYTIEPNGDLTKCAEIQSTDGVVACHLCADGDAVYAVNYLSGSVWKSDGKIAVHQGKGVHPKRQEAAHTHFVSLSPDNQYILVTDLGLDKIFVYDKNLNVVSTAHANPGAGPRHLAFSPDGKTVYCVNELTSTVTPYRYADGNLSFKYEYPTLPADFSGENTAAAIRYNNGYVYVSNRGHNTVTCFKAEGETLALQSITPCEGESPRDMILFDNFLLCTNETDGSVTLFETENHTKLNFIQKLDVKNALCAVEVQKNV